MTTYTGAAYTFPTFSDAPTGAQVSAFYTAIRDALTGCGLVQTADTGQLSVASTTWPGTANTAQGYFIYRFNDSVQGTDPVFLKITLGRGNASGAQRITVQAGQGSDGAGNLTGSTTDALLWTGYWNTTQAGTTAQSCYACHIDGYFMLVFGHANIRYNCAVGWGVVERTRNVSSGAFDARGVVISHRYGDTTTFNGHRAQSLRWSGALKSSDTAACCLVVGEPADTALLSGDKQLYPWWFEMAGVEQMWSACTVRRSEVSSTVTTFSATPYKTTSRTMIHFGLTGNGSGMAANARQNDLFSAAFVWE